MAFGCVQDLLVYPPRTWCRAFISTAPMSDVIDNNMCESFNSIILDARVRHIVHILEKIRITMMNRLKTR